MRLVEFSELTPKQLDLLLKIYREAFEAPWEWSVERIAGLATAAASDLPNLRGLALLEHEQPAALAIVEYLPAGNFCSLHYLAVERRQRGSGLGSVLFEAIRPLGEALAQAAGQAGCLGLILEIELIEGPPPNADREQRRKRLAFYRRHGALMADMLVPRPPGAPSEMPDWEILLLPGHAWDSAGPRKMDGELRRRIIHSLMVEGYGVSPDAAWLITYLDGISLAT